MVDCLVSTFDLLGLKREITLVSVLCPRTCWNLRGLVLMNKAIDVFTIKWECRP